MSMPLAGFTTRSRAGTLSVLASALMLTQAAPVSAEPTGTVPARTATAGKTAATAQAKAEGPARSACNRDTFRVVVDVGHTAGNPGAMSARGAYEYDFNLQLAKVIDQKLQAAGFTRSVLLITTDNKRRALFERIHRAQAMSGDLFLSIHHDSVPDRFLQKWEFRGEQRAYSDRFKGHSIFVSQDNADYSGSVQFARLLGQQLKERGLKYTPHYTEKFMGSRQRILVDADAGVYRYDQLIVLRNNRIPAVLLEAGSIINRDEELEMATPERRAAIGSAAVSAIESFCAARSTAVARAPQAAPAPKVMRAGIRTPANHR
jgi:N-acetylmuramoyl-L-alanine amidase